MITNKKGVDISLPSFFERMDVSEVFKKGFSELVMDMKWVDELECLRFLSCDSVSSSSVEIDREY